MERQANWATAFYMETEAGAYLGVDTIDWAINKLRRIRTPMDDADEAVGHQQEKREVTRKKEMRDALVEHLEDHLARDQGIRQTFARGYIRRRAVKHEDLEATNLKGFVQSHLAKWDGSTQ